MEGLLLTGKSAVEGKECIKALWNMFVKTDASMIEVNPLAETPDGKVVVCDAKINFDDNAFFRQADIFAKRDFTQEDAREVEVRTASLAIAVFVLLLVYLCNCVLQASKWDLNYIGLDGNIGCMVNGAGLAMATMDIIKLHGGSPANFLDEILNSDSKVQAILVNIFGGIMRCDIIAQGVIAAAKKIGLRKPVVLRLQGTNVKEAKAFIEASGYRIIMVDDLDKAAETAVRVADIKRQAEEISLNVSFELPL
jgi:succinyl-CoA synthetase beta subunit